MESDSSWGVVLVDVFNSKLSISAVEMDLSETYLLIDWSERRLPLQNFFFFFEDFHVVCLFTGIYTLRID